MLAIYLSIIIIWIILSFVVLDLWPIILLRKLRNILLGPRLSILVRNLLATTWAETQQLSSRIEHSRKPITYMLNISGKNSVTNAENDDDSGVRYPTDVKLTRFRSLFKASYVSSHTEVLSKNQTKYIWMAIYIYKYIYIYIYTIFLLMIVVTPETKGWNTLGLRHTQTPPHIYIFI